MQTFLGIDFGTSGARAIVIDLTLTIQWEKALTFPGATETVLATLWQETLFELLAAIPFALKNTLKAIASLWCSFALSTRQELDDLCGSPLKTGQGRKL